MYIRRGNKPVFAKDHEGRTISKADLPPRDTVRWVARRKAVVVAAVNGGIITAEEACELYDLSPEELESWQESLAKHGTSALRVTTLQRYRQN
ncbi:MAG: DUF1153 domain-containing protein [Pseudomonadota bacterium]